MITYPLGYGDYACPECKGPGVSASGRISVLHRPECQRFAVIIATWPCLDNRKALRQFGVIAA